MKASGFTMLEMVIALVLITVVIGNVYWLIQKSMSALGSQSSAYDIDSQARRTMDKITMAIVGAADDELFSPTAKPGYTPYLNYKESLGLDANGQNQLSDQQRIELTNAEGGEVMWKQNPDQSNEKRVILGKGIPQFLKDELANGVDDNANGIIDETGLSFTKNGKSITVWLTLRHANPDGSVVSRELHETVTCRN